MQYFSAFAAVYRGGNLSEAKPAEIPQKIIM